MAKPATGRSICGVIRTLSPGRPRRRPLGCRRRRTIALGWEANVSSTGAGDRAVFAADVQPPASLPGRRLRARPDGHPGALAPQLRRRKVSRPAETAIRSGFMWYSLSVTWTARLAPTSSVCPQPFSDTHSTIKTPSWAAGRVIGGRLFRMIPARMSRPARVLLVTPLTVAISVIAAACGTQRVNVPKSQGPLYQGAVLFNQRCAGCHTLSYAATHGSAANVRTAQANNGPNFDVRCERPVARVLYAIQNGGFSGAIMPQNVVVGPDAIAVAQFVATYAGRQAPAIPGVVPCQSKPVGSVPALASTTATTPKASTSTSAKSKHATSTAKKRAAAVAGTVAKTQSGTRTSAPK